MAEKVLMRSTRGVGQEYEFALIPKGDGCCVRSEVRIAGRLPQTGPSLLSPVSPEVARRWLDSQTAKLRRNAARFEPVATEEAIAKSVGMTVSVLDNPTVLLETLLYQALAGQFSSPKKP